MAIDPRIALGVQPVQQQPNMLAQYAQIMGIKAAQQEMEGNEGVRSALSQGVPDDPSTLLQYGKQGRATYESLLKGRKEKLESDDKRNVMLGGLAGPVMENPTLANFEFTLNRAVNYGLMTPEQRQQTLAQYGGSPESIKAYASNVFKGSITAQAQQADITSRRNTDVSSGASYGQLELSKKKDAREQAVFDLIQSALTGGATPPATAPVAPPMGGGSGPAAAPVAGSPASTNVLRDQVAPQGGAAPVSSVGVNNLTAQPSVVAPVTSPTTAPAALTKDEQVKEIDLKIEKLSMIPDPRAKSAVEMLLKRREILEPTKGPLVNINMPEDRKSFEMKVGPEGTKFAYKGLEKAQNAAEIINNVNVGKSILDKGMISGFGANFLVGLNQALKTGGIDFGYADASANSQAYAAAMAQNVGKLITLFGAGTGLSDADRAYAEQMAAGKINLDEAALRKILRINEDVSRRGIESHNKKMKQMGAPDYLQVEIPFEPPADIKDLWPYMTPEDKMLWQK